MQQADTVGAAAATGTVTATAVAGAVGATVTAADDGGDTSFLIQPNMSPTAILLVDASGSVTGDFSGVGGGSIFQRFVEIAKTLPHERWRVLFWNSDNETNRAFPGGYLKIPYMVDSHAKLDQWFGVITTKIGCNCVTMPHIAFAHVDDWLDEGFSNVVYLFTDGEIGWEDITVMELRGLKNKLRHELKRMVDKRPDVQLNIVAVENKRRDFSRAESLTNAAGCDVYQTLNEHNLTRHVARFVSHTPETDRTTGHVHINRTRAPPGQVPFRDSYFSPLHAGKFARHVWHLIRASKADINDLMRLLQDLSVSLGALCEGKSATQCNHTVEEYSRMFADTAVDEVIVKFMLDSALKDEFSGRAGLFAEYRARLKDLYKQADQLLHQDVRSALGVPTEAAFVSPPIHGTVVLGPSAQLCDRPVYPLGGKDKHSPFRQAAYQLDGQLVPMLLPLGYVAPPIDNASVSMGEQCARQWVRQLIAALYHLHPTGNQVVYRALGLMLQAGLSAGLEERVKDTYRQMGSLVLRKKRVHSDSSELAAIRNGSLMVDQKGRHDELFKEMAAMGQCLGLHRFRPLTLWYLVCLCLGDETTAINQFAQCRDDIRDDFGEAAAASPAAAARLLEHEQVTAAFDKSFVQHVVPADDGLDYTCLITLNDTSLTGGFAFNEHDRPRATAHRTCRPAQVLTVEGHAALLASGEACLCPVCYTMLSADDFRPVGPKAGSPPPGSVFATGLARVFHHQAAPDTASRAINERETQPESQCPRLHRRRRRRRQAQV